MLVLRYFSIMQQADSCVQTLLVGWCQFMFCLPDEWTYFHASTLKESTSSMGINIAEGCGLMVINRTHGVFNLVVYFYVYMWMSVVNGILMRMSSSLLLILPVFLRSNLLEVLSLIFIEYMECMLWGVLVPCSKQVHPSKHCCLDGVKFFWLVTLTNQHILTFNTQSVTSGMDKSFCCCWKMWFDGHQ